MYAVHRLTVIIIVVASEKVKLFYMFDWKYVLHSKSDIISVADLTLRKSAWGNKNTNGRHHYYEGYFVSWKTEPISMRATAQSVRFVSERVMTLAAALEVKSTSAQARQLEITKMYSGAEQKDGQQPCQPWGVS